MHILLVMICYVAFIYTYVHIILEPTFNNTIIKGAIIGTFFPAAAGIVLHIIYIYGAIALLIIYLFCHLLCFPFDISCIIYKFWWARACWRFSKQLFLYIVGTSYTYIFISYILVLLLCFGVLDFLVVFVIRDVAFYILTITYPD